MAERTAAQQKVWNEAVAETTAEMGSRLEEILKEAYELYEVAERIGRECRTASASERHEKVTVWVEDLIEAVTDLEYAHYEYQNRYGL